MATELYWVEGPWPGKLALAPRPRGSDWLTDEVKGWRREGINIVLSLLMPEEERDLDLQSEAGEVKAQGLKFLSLPIPDLQVPNSQTELAATLEKLDAGLSSGKNIVVHCRQGVGRTGLVAACLLIAKGTSPENAVKTISAARGVTVPETQAQRDWIKHYAAVLAGAK